MHKIPDVFLKPKSPDSSYLHHIVEKWDDHYYYNTTMPKPMPPKSEEEIYKKEMCQFCGHRKIIIDIRNTKVICGKCNRTVKYDSIQEILNQ